MRISSLPVAHFEPAPDARDAPHKHRPRISRNNAASCLPPPCHVDRLQPLLFLRSTARASASAASRRARARRHGPGRTTGDSPLILRRR